MRTRTGTGAVRAWRWSAVALLAAVVVLAPTASAGTRTGTARTLLARHSVGVRLATGAALSGHAAACGSDGLVCTTVTVPLDRTGVVPGTIGLHVEELPPQGAARGAMFLIAGGPGQGSAHVFGLGTPDADALFRYLFPGYTLIAYDDRGTGESGLLDCPALQVAITADAERDAAAACGTSLGAAASFYSTADHAEDLDAVRQALGFQTVGVYGVSYGTKLAMAYALAHPANVDHVVLDSVVPPQLDDSYSSNVLQSLPSTLATLCATGCKGTTLSSDLVALANAYAAKPLQGKVLTPSGRTATKKIEGLDLLSIVLDADLNPGIAAELPGVLHAARQGNTAPLLRLAVLHDATSAEDAIDLSSALYAATVCRDGPFPWTPDTPVANRSAILQAAIAALPAGTLGPFGSWAARFGNADFCLGWPAPTGGAALGVGPLPNVPMLAVSGGFDMRTPTKGAAAVTALFPQGHLVTVPGVGHDPVDADLTGCAVNAVRSFMLGSVPSATCPRSQPLVAPVSALPAPGVAKPAKPLPALGTYAAVKETLQDAQAVWLMTAGLSGSTVQVAGVFGGRLVAGARTIKLVNYGDARGVALSGTLTLKTGTLPLAFQGAIAVGGTAGAHGVLGLSGTSLRGALGGRPVG